MFSALGECWSVFFTPQNYMDEYKKVENRMQMASSLEKAALANQNAVDMVKELILEVKIK